MIKSSTAKSWSDYFQQELQAIRPILKNFGFAVDEQQPLIGGEFSSAKAKKLVLSGRQLKDDKRVIIKVSSDPEGQAEIKSEHNSRNMLDKLNFAYNVFLSPAKLLFSDTGQYTILITEFIDQESTFLEKDLKEQFFLSLKIFALQEGAQAVTYEHRRSISQDFGWWQAEDYLEKIDQYLTELQDIKADDQRFKQTLSKARQFFADNLPIVDLYCGWLAHWDLVPHNFRIRDNEVYILDHTSLRFGNKYESWARFINFMMLYNPELAKLLVNYVRDNREQEESLSLQLLRIYRLIELIRHYAKSLKEVSGDLLTLNKKRIEFWHEALMAVLAGQELPTNTIEDYRKIRDSLRDEAEKQRQAAIY